MNSMREAGEDSGLERGRAFSTNTKLKGCRIYNVGPKDREDKSWMSESQIVGRLPDDDSWNLDT
jgi:hypothetical protein